VVDEDPKRSKWREAPGDRVRLPKTIDVGLSPLWRYEPGPEDRARTCDITKEGAAGGASTDIRCVHTSPFTRNRDGETQPQHGQQIKGILTDLLIGYWLLETFFGLLSRDGMTFHGSKLGAQAGASCRRAAHGS
jgi:hypothetical protein